MITNKFISSDLFNRTDLVTHYNEVSKFLGKKKQGTLGDIVYKRNSEDGIIAIWTTTCTFQSVTSTYKFLYELYVNGDSTHMLTHRFCDMAKGRSRNVITLTKNEWRLFVSPIWNEHLNKMSLKSKILDL